jgi:hypothetical protein
MLKNLIETWIAADRERSIAVLHRRVLDTGAKVSYNTVHTWATGSGIKEHHKVPLATAMGVPVEAVLRAAAGLPPEAGS